MREEDFPDCPNCKFRLVPLQDSLLWQCPKCDRAWVVQEERCRGCD